MKVFLETTPVESAQTSKQFSTFIIDGRLYGIDVMKVQEVTKPMPVTLLPTAPAFIKGLINLRGQIATAIGLRELFNLAPEPSLQKMTVVCRIDDVLISLLVDSIGDVVEVQERSFEPSPATIHPGVRGFMEGVYKTDSAILSIINLETIINELEKRCA